MAPPTDMRHPPRGTFVQTDREAHKAWAMLSARKPAASAVLHLLAGNVGKQNAVVISQRAIAKAIGISDRTVGRAIADLAEANWLQIVRIGVGKEAAYVLNDRVVWASKRDALRLSRFSAVIVADAEEQTEDTLSRRVPLHRLPVLPAFDGGEGDAPAPDCSQ